MKNSATKAFCLILVLFSTAFAKPPKCQVRCYQSPTCGFQTLAAVYCLQWPTLSDAGSPPQCYFVYDQYDDPTTCSLGPYADYGWALCSRPTPQSCAVLYDCENMLPPRDSLCRAASSGHQLKTKIKKDEKHKQRMPDKAWVIDKTGHTWEWNPQDGIVSSVDEWFIVHTQNQGGIAIKVLTTVVDFTKAAAAAHPPIPLDVLKHVPPPRTIVLGIESDVNVSNPVLSGKTAVNLEAGADFFSGEIKPSSTSPIKIRIITNTMLK